MSTPVQNTRSEASSWGTRPPRGAWRLVVPLIAILQAAGAVVTAAPTLERDGPDAPILRSGAEFKAALDRWISASWHNASEDGKSSAQLRRILSHLSETFQVSIVLDRRIDPTQEVAVNLVNRKLSDALRDIAGRASAGMSVLANTVYVGPPASAARLRTLAELRMDELFAMSSDLPKGRQFSLGKRIVFPWDDLDRPADLVRRIAERYDLDVQEAQLMPHDLWAGATLPRVNAVEALSLVLIQFDLTFAWSEAAAGIRLLPVPSDVWVKRTYTSIGRDTSAAVRVCHEQMPDLEITAQGSQLVVRGTMEQHDAVAMLLRLGIGRRSSRRPRSSGPPPLIKRLFTLSVANVPVKAVIQQLESSGMTFDYDAEKMTAAGVDFSQTVTIDVKNASADEFFEAVFGPVGVDFTLHNVTVTLTPGR